MLNQVIYPREHTSQITNLCFHEPEQALTSNPSTPSNPLLMTKLDIPSIRSAIFPRARLISELNKGLEQRVTTVIAPAGYGKTTLLYDWITSQTLADRITWVSLDRFDNTPSQFWAYIVAGFKKAIPELTFDHTFFQRQSLNSQDMAILNPLFNELTGLSRDIILVLDNFQVITNRDVLASLSYLIEYQPRNLHLVISSRTNPALPLSRLSIQHSLVGLNSTELAFTPTETKQFLASIMKIRLEQYLITDLYNNTEGWITGIQMVALAMQNKKNRRFTAYSKQYDLQELVNFLSEEVLLHQPEHIQDFLLKTSILTEFSPAICDEILQKNDSKEILNYLLQQDLFILPTDQSRTWYRYRTFFAEALTNLLQQKQPDLYPVLNQKASLWSYEHGYPGNAIDYAIAAGDLDRATDILDENAMQAIIQFNQPGLIHWTSHFPENLLRLRPNLGIYYALANLMMGQYDAVEPVLLIVEGVLDSDSTQIASEDRDIFRWKIAVVRFIRDLKFGDRCDNELLPQILSTNPLNDAYMYGYLNHMLASHYHRLPDFNMAEKEYVAGCQYAQEHQIVHGHVFSLCGLARIRKQQGRLKEAEWEYRRAQKLLQPITEPNPTGQALIKSGLGELAILRNDLDTARQLFEEIIDQYDQIEHGFEWQEYHIIQIRLVEYCLYIKDIQAAQYYLKLCIQTWISFSKPGSIIMPEFVDVQKQIWILNNEYETAAVTLKSRMDLLEKWGKTSLAEEVAYAHILILQNNTEQAFQIISRAGAEAEKLGWNELLYEIHILMALIHAHSGQMDLALNETMRVIQSCAVEEYTRVFYSHGPVIRDLVAENRRKHQGRIENALVTNFLEKLTTPSPFSASSQSDLSQKPSNTSEEIKNLSTREIEILELLAEGKSIKEISSELMISINTTKTHVKSIYRKFGEHNGKAVIHRAVDLGLLNNQGTD